MRKLKYWLLIFLVLWLESCGYDSSCKKISLTNNEKTWFKSYNSFDTIFFKSNRGNIDTFKIDLKNSYYTPCNKIELSDFQYQIMHTQLCLVDSNGGAKRRISLEFSKKYQDTPQPCIKYFRVFGVTVTNKDLDNAPSEKIISSATQKVYNSYLFKKEDLTSSSLKIKSFNWDKKEGLVRYTLHSDEVYDLWKKK